MVWAGVQFSAVAFPLERLLGTFMTELDPERVGVGVAKVMWTTGMEASGLVWLVAASVSPWQVGASHRGVSSAERGSWATACCATCMRPAS